MPNGNADQKLRAIEEEASDFREWVLYGRTEKSDGLRYMMRMAVGALLEESFIKTRDSLDVAAILVGHVAELNLRKARWLADLMVEGELNRKVPHPGVAALAEVADGLSMGRHRVPAIDIDRDGVLESLSGAAERLLALARENKFIDHAAIEAKFKKAGLLSEDGGEEKREDGGGKGDDKDDKKSEFVARAEHALREVAGGLSTEEDEVAWRLFPEGERPEGLRHAAKRLLRRALMRPTKRMTALGAYTHLNSAELVSAEDADKIRAKVLAKAKEEAEQAAEPQTFKDVQDQATEAAPETVDGASDAPEVEEKAGAEALEEVEEPPEAEQARVEAEKPAASDDDSAVVVDLSALKARFSGK
ncbi:MAG: hypothetical protein ABIA47_01925 [bacterium]